MRGRLFLIRLQAERGCWFAGRFRVFGWFRWMPIVVGPTFSDPKHPFRTAGGVAVSFFRWGFYLFRSAS